LQQWSINKEYTSQSQAAGDEKVSPSVKEENEEALANQGVTTDVIYLPELNDDESWIIVNLYASLTIAMHESHATKLIINHCERWLLRRIMIIILNTMPIMSKF